MPTHLSAAEAPEDLWRCNECGWTYPNHHPSAKHRRNHKKQCGKLPGFPISRNLTPGDSPSGYPASSPSYYASSDDDYLRSPLYAAPGADQKNERGLDLSPSLSPVPGSLKLAGSGDQDVSASRGIGQLLGGDSPAASSFDKSRSIDILATDAENLPDERSPEMPGIRIYRSARAEGSRWICRHCGFTYPNAHPSAKHRRNHKKKCGAPAYVGTAGSSDETSSDEDPNHLKGKLPLDTEQPASQVDSELQTSSLTNVSSTTTPAAAKDISIVTDTTDESFNDETRPEKTDRNLEFEDKAMVDPVSEKSQTTTSTAPGAEDGSLPSLIDLGSNFSGQDSGANEEVQDPALEERADDEVPQIDNDDKLGSKHVEDSSELGQGGALEEDIDAVISQPGARREEDFQNSDVRRREGIFEVAEAQEPQRKFNTSEDHGVSPREAHLPEPGVSSRESAGIPGSRDFVSNPLQPVGFDAAESLEETLNEFAEKKSRAIELKGAVEDPVADINVVDEAESFQTPTVISSEDSNHTVTQEDQAEKAPDSSHSSEDLLPSETEVTNPSPEPPVVAELADGSPPDDFEGQVLPPPSKGRPESENILSNDTTAESEKGLGIDLSDQRVVEGLSKEFSPASEDELKSPLALGNDSHEPPAAVAGEEKLSVHSEEQTPSPSDSQIPDGISHGEESTGAEPDALEIKGADHHGLAEQQEESGDPKSVEAGDIDAGSKTSLKLDKDFKGSQVSSLGSASSPGDRNSKPVAKSKLQTAEPGGRRAELLQENLQSSEPGKVDDSSPGGLVRARVQAFEKLAGAGAGVDYQQRRKSFSPSKLPSPGTPVTPGVGYQHPVQSKSAGQAERVNVPSKNVHESPKGLQEAISHLRNGSNSNGKAASAERDVPPSEAFQVKSHLRQGGKIF